ncbi:MAG: endolytic transglycosylase MltG [Chloroflexota bacterium]
MRRLIQGLAILFFLTAFSAVACIAAIFIITGDDPLTASRTGMAELSIRVRSDELNTPAGNADTPVRFTVEPGTSTIGIASNLFGNGLITDAELFVNYTIANDIATELEAGTYFLTNSMTIPEIAIALTDSNSSQLPFRILEGWRMEEVAASIDQSGLFGFTGDEFMATVQRGADVPQDFAAYVGLPDGASLEGFLYPDTYVLPPGITALELRDTLLQTFREHVTIQMVNDALEQDLSIFEAVTLASIAEREAVHNEEFPLIMSVYRNRLVEGMTLGADPTVQYALNGTRGRWWSNITRADYTGVISPYNTYINEGLPPGPIASAGIESITAAIYPQETEFLFFRAACDRSGYHEFAKTYEDHLQNGCGG